LGFLVDDNNKQAPENILLPQEKNNNAATDNGRTWGWDGIDHGKQANGLSMRARINCLSGLALEGATMLTIFLLFFPWKFLEEVIIIKATKRITGMQVTFEEFLQFLGLWLYMSSLSGFGRSDYWSSNPVSIHGALCKSFPLQALR
jgi:hypothetical protein